MTPDRLRQIVDMKLKQAGFDSEVDICACVDAAVRDALTALAEEYEKAAELAHRSHAETHARQTARELRALVAALTE